MHRHPRRQRPSQQPNHPSTHPPPTLFSHHSSLRFPSLDPFRAAGHTLLLITDGTPALPFHPVPSPQWISRLCSVPLLSNENRASLVPSPSTSPATCPPSAGPCLNPCPDPPPTSHTFSNSGCRSIRKSPLEVFSYWQTRVSTTGASFRAGKRWARKSRTAASPSGVVTREPVSGSKGGPWLSRAALKPRPSRSGMP